MASLATQIQLSRKWHGWYYSHPQAFQQGSQVSLLLYAQVIVIDRAVAVPICECSRQYTKVSHESAIKLDERGDTPPSDSRLCMPLVFSGHQRHTRGAVERRTEQLVVPHAYEFHAV